MNLAAQSQDSGPDHLLRATALPVAIPTLHHQKVALSATISFCAALLRPEWGRCSRTPTCPGGVVENSSARSSRFPIALEIIFEIRHFDRISIRSPRSSSVWVLNSLSLSASAARKRFLKDFHGDKPVDGEMFGGGIVAPDIRASSSRTALILVLSRRLINSAQGIAGARDGGDPCSIVGSLSRSSPGPLGVGAYSSRRTTMALAWRYCIGL